METEKKIKRAIVSLIFDSPFFASIIMRQALKLDETCNTMYVDGVSLGYNPTFIDSLSLAELTGVLAHESMHLANAHHARRQSRNARKWNIATDTSINKIVINAGFVLPKECLPGNELSAESNYAKLPENAQDDSSQGKGDTSDDPGQCGEVRDMPGANGARATEAEMAQGEAESKVMAAQAYQQAKTCGKVPNGLDRFVKNTLYPTLDWKAILRQFVDNTAKNDYSWAYPNRRHIHSGLYLPGVISEELNNVVIAVDTSGSLSEENLLALTTEISGVLEAYPTNIIVIYCDYNVTGIEQLTRENLPLQLNAKGGGCTCYKPPFEYLRDNDIAPNCMLYLTDGCCSSFPDTPDFPVLWITDHYHFVPPFGEVVKLDNSYSNAFPD